MDLMVADGHDGLLVAVKEFFTATFRLHEATKRSTVLPADSATRQLAYTAGTTVADKPSEKLILSNTKQSLQGKREAREYDALGLLWTCSYVPFV